MNYVKTAIAAAVLAMAGSAASAATTIDFTGTTPGNYTSYVEDGFVFDEVRIVNGNCDSPSGRPCGAENDNEASTLTQVGGGTFSVSSIWFQLLGNGTNNTVTFGSDKGSFDFMDSVFGSNDGGQTVDLSSVIYNGVFTDISSFFISTLNGGNVRFDDITIAGTPAPVPLPAAGMLLLGGLGTMAAIRRRKRA